MTDRIYLNVGGDRYEISRGLLMEQHKDSMLASLVAERWQQLEQQPEQTRSKVVFIDRDGKVFRHVLNYMRYGSVCLPVGTASKKDFLRELDYYGIAVEDEGSTVQQEAFVDTAAIVGKAVRRELQRLAKQIPSDIVAAEVYRVYQEDDGEKLVTRVSSNPDILDPDICQAFDKVYENFDEEHFNHSLKKYGLRFKRFEPTWGSINIHVEPTATTTTAAAASEPSPMMSPMEYWMDSFQQENGYLPAGPQGYGYHNGRH